MSIDWTSTLREPDYVWETRFEGATDEEVARLAAYCGRPLPAAYVAFLRQANGGGLWYDDLWYIRFWRSEDIPSWSAAYQFGPARIPGALAFGDDGGDECLVFDMRPDHPDGEYPVYAVNFISVGWKEAILVAPDFTSLLLLRRELLHSVAKPDHRA